MYAIPIVKNHFKMLWKLLGEPNGTVTATTNRFV